tara:strand:- start:2332 stop:3987 length:1656 start_codon:yes stop_codon:yes gene_type:complete
VNDYPHPRELNLDYPRWRPGQLSALEWLESNAWLDKDNESWSKPSLKVIEAPTGTGKTGLILALSALNSDLRFIVLCATKQEQEQYLKNLAHEDNDIVTVKGKNNFHCVYKHPDTQGVNEECQDAPCSVMHVDEAPCTVGFECPVRGECFYFKQRRYAFKARVVIANYAIGLSVLNYLPEALGFGHRDVIVEDEGHILDEQLETFLQVKLTRNTVRRLFGIELPHFKEGGTIPEWKGWLKGYWEAIRDVRSIYSDIPAEELSSREVRELLALDSYIDRFKRVKDMDFEWVVEEDSSGYTFMPVWVTQDSREVLFKHANRHIIMSGTIPSSTELANKVGLSVSDFEFFRLPYTFPPENRPIVLDPRVSLKYADIELNLGALCDVVDEYIVEHLDKKILVHSKNYNITRYLAEHSQFMDSMFTHNTQNRNAVLEEFKLSPPPAILVSPSFDKAVDLPGDECELIIVAKVPYPYLGSKVMKRRAQENRRYYTHETLMTLIQMAGRGVRSEVDVCPTIVVDKLGPSFFGQARGMIPKGIQDAINAGKKLKSEGRI